MLEKKEDFDFSQDEERLREVLGRNFSENLKLKKHSLLLGLSLSTFETQCHLVNDLLMEKNLLLRVYEFRKKFCYLIKKIPRGKNTVQRERSACVEEHFNGFNLVKKLTENSIRQLYRLIDIVYKPVSDINQIINCFFTVSMRNPYRVVSNKTKKSFSITTADQCYGCNKFFIERKSLERRMNVCGHFPGIVYKFENQNIQTFFDNMKFMGDLPFSIYFDLETTTGKKVYNFDEDATLYPVSYAFVITFHPSLNIEKISVVRSFNPTFEQLNDVS